MKVYGGEPDRLEVVNGPEDGTVFPLTRTPFDIGSDPGCNVSLRLEPELRRIHARVTVVAEGFVPLESLIYGQLPFMEALHEVDWARPNWEALGWAALQILLALPFLAGVWSARRPLRRI